MPVGWTFSVRLLLLAGPRKPDKSAADAPDRGKVTILGRNPEAIWFSGYNDRVLYDEAGLFEEAEEMRLKVVKG